MDTLFGKNKLVHLKADWQVLRVWEYEINKNLNKAVVKIIIFLNNEKNRIMRFFCILVY